MVKLKKGLLFVSYYFPPTKSIAAVRNFNICSEFNKTLDISVLTTNNQNRFYKDDFPHLEIRRLKKLFTFDPRTLVSKKPLQPASHSNASISLLQKVLRSFPFNIFFGIGGLIYIINGLVVGYRYTKSYNIKVLYSSYFPYSDHIICYLIKLFNKDLFWIADFRDLQYYPKSKEIIFPQIQIFFNRIILKKASIVTTVSEGLKSHLLPFNNNVEVVRNSIGKLNSTFSSASNSNSKRTLNLTYTGNIIPGKSRPESIFEILKAIKAKKVSLFDQIEFNYLGAYKVLFSTLAEKYSVSEVCKIRETVPISQSIKFQQDASINILLSFNSEHLKGILTGKFYEYLAAQKPILLIINGKQDLEFERIFKELNCGVVLYIDDPNFVPQAVDFIESEFVKFKENLQGSQYNQEKLKEFSTAFQLKKVLDSIEKSLNTPPS
jgi:hypothetical protein